MALSGLQIQKLLPKTNCKECGSNTCLAFAMKLAAKKALLSECPYASEEAVKVLGADSEPPVKSITIGGEKPVKLGEETVLYRHEKTFVNQTVLAININDTDNNIDETLEKIRDYKLERVGEVLTIGAVAVTQKGSDADFLALVKKACDTTRLPLLLRAASSSSMNAAAEALKGNPSVLCGVTEANADEAKKAAEEHGHVLAVTSADIDGVARLTDSLKSGGFNNLIIELPALTLAESFQLNSIARKSAIKSNYKPLGYATIKFINTGNQMSDTVEAVNEINKYGGICVLPSFDPSQLVTLMTLRLNIYTDPQKPIQVEPKLYPINEPGKNSPVFVTTNFSLTYFLVSGEIENTGLNAWLVIPDCEGMSVLTAWAAGKFSGAVIAKAVKEYGVEDITDDRRIVIPGYVAQISGELEEALPGWQVIIAPQEAADIEGFVKSVIVK